MALGAKTGGRKAGVPNKATADVKALAQKYAPAAMAELARLSVEAESEQARVAACKEIMDRAYGKAPMAAEDQTGPIVIQVITYGDAPSAVIVNGNGHSNGVRGA